MTAFPRLTVLGLMESAYVGVPGGGADTRGIFTKTMAIASAISGMNARVLANVSTLVVEGSPSWGSSRAAEVLCYRERIVADTFGASVLGVFSNSFDEPSINNL